MHAIAINGKRGHDFERKQGKVEYIRAFGGKGKTMQTYFIIK